MKSLPHRFVPILAAAALLCACSSARAPAPASARTQHVERQETHVVPNGVDYGYLALDAVDRLRTP